MIVMVVSAVVHLVAMASLPLMVTPDGQKYIAEALQLMGRAPAMNIPGWDAPGMPLFLAVGFALLGVTPVAVLFLQHTLGVVCVYLITRASLELSTPRIALVVGLLAAVEPWSLMWTSYVLTEPLASAVLMGATWLTITAARRGVSAAAGVGLLCAVALLTRPASVVLLPFFVAAWMFAQWANPRRWLMMALLIGGTLVPPVIVRLMSPIRPTSDFVSGAGMVLFWGAGMFGMVDRTDVVDPSLQATYDRTAGNLANPNADDRQVRFLRESGAQDDAAAARAVAGIATRAVLRQPGRYARNVALTLLWYLNVGIDGKPPMYDELTWLTNRIFLDGREFRQNASNFQGVNFAPVEMRAFAVDYRGGGPLRPYLELWTKRAHTGLPHVPLVVATLGAIVIGIRRRRWALVLLFAAPLAYIAAHSVLLAAVTRYASSVTAMTYVALAFFAHQLSARRAAS